MYLFGFVFTSCLLSGFASQEVDYKNDQIPEKWSKIALALEPLIWPHNQFLVHFLEVTLKKPPPGLSDRCAKSLLHTVEGIKRRKLWAFQMLDSSSKFASGFLSSRFLDYGDYDQCLGIEVNEAPIAFNGKYCLYRIHFPLPPHERQMSREINLTGTEMEGTWLQSVAKNYKILYFETINNAICSPSVCSSQEINALISKFASKIPVEIDMVHCDTREDSIRSHQYANYVIASGAILAFLAFLVVVSTLLSLNIPGSLPKALRCFCAYENSVHLLRETSEEEKRLSFVSGLKFIFLTIGFHLHVVVGVSYASRPLIFGIIEYLKKLTSDQVAFFSNGDLPISSFICLGGILNFVAWHSFTTKTNAKLNFTIFVVPRLLRLYPIIVGNMLITFALQLVPGSGPLMIPRLQEDLSTVCVNNMWTDLLFLSNMFEKKCFVLGWFLAADIQLYVTSFFVIWLLLKNPKKGLVLTALIIICSIIGHGVYLYVTNRGIFTDVTDPDIKKTIDDAHYIYYNTVNHISAYYIGVLIGYVIANDIVIQDGRKVTVAWVSFILSVVLYNHFFGKIQRKGDFNSLEALVLGSLRRPFSAVTHGWLFYATFIKRGGIFGWICSRRVLVPITRMFVSINSVHFPVIIHLALTSRNPQEFRTFDLLMRTCSVICFSLIFGYLFYILIEAPSVRLVKMLFSKDAVIKPKASQQLNNNNAKKQF